MKGLILLLSVLGGAANAEPTYLTCSLDRAGGSVPVDVVVDEAGQVATVELPRTGRVVSRTAMIAPDKVRIFDEESTWIIDRVTLAFRRVVRIGDKESAEDGKCSLKPTPAKRAF